MLKSYKYCLLPTEEQKKTFDNWFGACRFVYNLALETKIAGWVSLRKNVSSFDLMKQLTELKKTECKWLAECPGQSLESAITNLDNAYTKFFKGGGFPNFKKKSNYQSITFRRDSKIENGKIRLTKIGWVSFVQHRPFDGEIRSVTVSKTPSNKYFVSILVKDENEIPLKKEVNLDTAVGIDVGLKIFATLSDGKIFENPKYLHHHLRRLKKERRTLSRRYKNSLKISEQSKSWHKQRIIVAKLYEKITNKRSDFLHKVSTAIVKQYDTICLESLNINGMIKNSKLSKSILDVSWYEFIRMIFYKSEWYGKNIIQIGMFEPSSKTCSNCGYIFKELKLSCRKWDCKKCGAHHNRDLNASINIKNFGLGAKPLTVNAGQ